MKTKGEFFMIKEMKERGMSISDIARELRMDRKTVRKYLTAPSAPVPSKRKQKASKLDPYKPYLDQRMLEDQVWNSVKLFEEIEVKGYDGGLTILKDYMKPYRAAAKKKYTMRYETRPGEQMQVDWKDVGLVEIDGSQHKLSLFVVILGYSRMKYAWLTDKQDLEHVMEGLIRAFEYFGGVPQRLLFDNMKTVVHGRDQGRVLWNERFAAFADYYGFIPKACRPYRAQTKGKVERSIQYLQNHFLQGRPITSLDQTNLELLRWLDQTGNRKIHQTTGISPQERWADEQLRPIHTVKRYDTSYHTYRKSHWDGSLSYRGEKWMLASAFAGKGILIKETLHGDLSMFCQGSPVSFQRFGPSASRWGDYNKKKQTAPADHRPSASLSSLDVDTRSLTFYDRFSLGEQS